MNCNNKERPILFSGPMVQAILDGRKTQTRRAIKLNHSGRAARAGRNWHLDDPNADKACPYGAPGDRLWVRETWRVIGGREYEYQERIEDVKYRANLSDVLESGNAQWRPSIFMPRWASRIELEITEIRVQRLQEISEGDAIAEGIERVGGAASCSPWKNYRLGKPGEMSMHCSCPTRSYMTLWESINGPGSWAANPWVWCVSFKRVQP